MTITLMNRKYQMCYQHSFSDCVYFNFSSFNLPYYFYVELHQVELLYTTLYSIHEKEK